MLFNKKKRFFTLLIAISFLFSVFAPCALAASPLFPLPISFIRDTPASFQNVTYEVKEGVVEVDGKLGNAFQTKVKLYDELTNPGYESSILPREKLKSMGMVKKSDFYSVISQYEKGMVLLDKTNNLAVKVIDDVTLTGDGAGDYISLKMPQVHEVLSDFSIPEQSVELTRGNITGFAPGVEEAAVAGDMAFRSTAGGGDTHLSDNPLIKFNFNPDETLIAYDENGLKFNVKLEGHFGIDRITTEGHYYYNDGYKLVLKTAEELKLKVSCAASLSKDKKLTIPICNIGVPAGFANVYGSIVVVAGANGNMELTVEAHQWLEAEAGIQGGTFLGVPTSFNVIKDIDHDFDVDLNFEGKINAYIKAGPVAALEIYGTNMAGAGLLIGLGGKVAFSAGYGESTDLTAEIYGLLEVYVTLLGNKKSIVDKKIILYQLTKPDTAGYIIQFYEACMYRNTVWGNIRQAGSGTPFAGQAVLIVEKTNGAKTALNVYCDAAGNFHINVNSAAGLTLSKDDKIYINSLDGTAISSDPIYPTFPFTEVVLDYADFFNDSATGYVTPARVMNWSTGEYQYIYYTGDIQFSLWPANSGTTYRSLNPSLYSSSTVSKTVTCDSEGNFKLNHDFKPGDSAMAYLNGYGTEIISETIMADTDIIGKRLKESTKSESMKDGLQTEQKAETERFLVYNLRGTKAVTQPGNLSVSYDYYRKPVSYFIGLDHSIAGHTYLGTVDLTLNMSPIYSHFSSPVKGGSSLSLSLPTGVSETFEHYITEYAWGGRGKDPEITLTGSAGKPVTLRYIYNSPKVDSATGQGVDFIARSGSLSFDYEGAEILNIAIEPDFKVAVIGLNESIFDGMLLDISPVLINDVKIRTAAFYSNASVLAIPELNKANSMGLVPDSLRGVDLTSPATRAEFVAVSVKVYEALSGTKLVPAASNPFTDTSDAEVLKAYSAGITAGVGGGIFAPDTLLSREQAATMLTRVFKKASMPGWTLETDSRFTLSYTKPAPFADDANISSWAKDSVYFMAANGILKGTGNNLFSPRPITAAEITANYASATREQVLLIAVRMVENLK